MQLSVSESQSQKEIKVSSKALLMSVNIRLKVTLSFKLGLRLWMTYSISNTTQIQTNWLFCQTCLDMPKCVEHLAILLCLVLTPKVLCQYGSCNISLLRRPI